MEVALLSFARLASAPAKTVGSFLNSLSISSSVK
jgi:hypothetical protein